MTDSTMTLKQWYKGILVPSPTSRNYRPFIASCVGIVNKIVERELEKTITVKFGECPTAYADQDNSLIFISDEFAKGNFTEASGGTYRTSEEIVPQILGIIVHEAAHFAFSPKDLTIIHKGVEDILGRKVNQQVAMRLGNVVEDIFIEWEVGNKIPQIIWMLDRLNENLLSTEAFIISRGKVMSQTHRPTGIVELANIVSHLIFAKIRFPMSTNPYMDRLWKLAQSAREAGTIQERIAIVAQLYELIMIDGGDEGEGEAGENEADTEDDDRQLGDSKGSGDQGKSGEGSGSSNEGNGESGDESPPEAPGDLSDLDGDKAMEDIPSDATADHGGPEQKIGSWTDDMIKEINSLIQRKIEEVQKDTEWHGVDKVYTMNRVTPQMTRDELELDTRYAALAKIGRQRATTNRPYGIDQRRGHSIRKLHRIATDGRIFAEPVQTQTYKPMEVILLIDCSGSMQWGDKIGKAGRAVIGAAAGLKEARCEVKVVGHTADFGDITLTLYDIKDWNDPISIASRRMRRLARGGDADLKLYQNRDHLAIKEVAKDFRASSAQRRQLLIVISDGEPCANNGYYGDAAIAACQNTVTAIRKTGIDVMSISIDKAAVESNDRIYGHQHNVCNDDPNVIEEVIRTLIQS